MSKTKRRKSRALFASAKPRRKGCLIYPLLLLLVVAVLAILNLINGSRVVLKTQSVTVAALPGDAEGFRILHISDLHGKRFGDMQDDFRRLLRDAKPGAVCVTGDVCAKDGDYQAFIELINLFASDVPVFFIAGDEDPEPLHTAAHGGNEVKADYVLAAEALGAVYLDAPQRVTVGKSTLWFCPESLYGLDIDSSRSAYLTRKAAMTANDDQYLPDNAALLRMIDYKLAVLDDCQQKRGEMKPGDVQIALTHHPLTHETLRTLQTWSGSERGDFYRGVALVLAGHYNAGQYRLPLLGAIRAPATAGLSSEWFPDDSQLVGLSSVQGISQYISPGLGTTKAYRLPVRLFNTPAVTLITLTARLGH